jgi:hypothetical protein
VSEDCDTKRDCGTKFCLQPTEGGKGKCVPKTVYVSNMRSRKEPKVEPVEVEPVELGVSELFKDPTVTNCESLNEDPKVCPNTYNEAKDKQNKFQPNINTDCKEDASTKLNQYSKRCYGDETTVRRKWDLNKETWRNHNEVNKGFYGDDEIISKYWKKEQFEITIPIEIVSGGKFAATINEKKYVLKCPEGKNGGEKHLFDIWVEKNSQEILKINLEEELEKFDLKQNHIKSDGDCLFEAFRLFLGDNRISKTIAEIREEIVKYITSDTNWTNLFINTIPARCYDGVCMETKEIYAGQMLQKWKDPSSNIVQIPRAHFGDQEEIVAFTEINWDPSKTFKVQVLKQGLNGALGGVGEFDLTKIGSDGVLTLLNADLHYTILSKTRTGETKSSTVNVPPPSPATTTVPV